jgi:hypothetical protein
MAPDTLHLTMSLSISYPDLIKFHDFVNNSQEGTKHQMRGATQAEQDVTLWITLIIKKKIRLQIMGQLSVKVRRLGGRGD